MLAMREVAKRFGASMALDGVSLDLAGGEVLALLGENGAGKSTLIRVLCGLVTPQAGRVTIDGTDLGSIDLAAWRAQLAVVFQDFVRFHVSLAENVAFGRLGLSSDRMALTGALRRAGSQTLPGDLPFGWDTVLDSAYDRGTALSGGQWQRVALARAFLAIAGGAKILILDEPTAALDVRSERQVFERIADLSAEVTTILVSHRLSSVRQVDRIVFLADGKVVEDGSHEQLMLLNQKYAAMFRLQAERFERI
jgi:ATP-binding cassette, subfamily B, bacterial